MTHRKHAAALLTAVLLLAPHRRLRPRPLRRPSSPPRPRHRRPLPEKTPAATAGRPSLNGACSKTTASRPTTTRISETASIRSM